MDVSTKTFDQVRREFEALEFDLEVKIKEILDKIQQISKKKYDTSSCLEEWKEENEAALQRNKNFLKNLEFTKAKLRSKYYYQPATNCFNIQLKKYKNHVEGKSDFTEYESEQQL